MDFGTLAPLILRAGAPLIADLMTTAATVTLGPAGGAVVGLVTHKVAEALGADPSPAGIAAAIDANPDHAAAALPQVEADHADLIQGALQQASAEIERARIDEQNVENARDLESKLVATGSRLQWVPVAMSVLAILGMVATSVAIGSGHMIESVTTGRIEGFWETVATAAFVYWLGNTAKASQRADQAIDFAHKAGPAGAVAHTRGR